MLASLPADNGCAYSDRQIVPRAAVTRSWLPLSVAALLFIYLYATGNGDLAQEIARHGAHEAYELGRRAAEHADDFRPPDFLPR